MSDHTRFSGPPDRADPPLVHLSALSSRVSRCVISAVLLVWDRMLTGSLSSCHAGYVYLDAMHFALASPLPPSQTTVVIA